MQTFDWNEVWSEVVALVKNFPTICGHITYMQVNQGDYRLLVVESQIGNLIPGFFWDHNLCFKYSNGSCEPILNIYVSRAFQWYKEHLNPICFDPCNYSLKIQKSIGTLILKVEAHLRMCGFIPSHLPTLLGTWNVNPRLHFQLAPLQALALVVSLRLGSWQT